MKTKVIMFLLASNVFLMQGMVMNIAKRVLSNGMTVIVKPNHITPKVSIQLWYNVGSADEKIGEKGVAHLIEHMIFKGTVDLLSETDIQATVHKLSGDCNAFTSYDYTGYKFNMPSHQWQQVLPIMADCMTNVAFKDDHLNSEMKAVIQELKMIKDNYVRQAIYDLLTLVFPDHPYHYPLIGYKQDLWSVSGNDLRAFYNTHYCPNNATLVIVGDVDAEECFRLAEQHFGHIPANPHYKKESFYHNQDIVSKSLNMYRDVQQPTGVVAFAIPGIKYKLSHLCDLAAIVLGGGKSSRLYKRLVEQDRTATSVSVTSVDLFDHGLFIVLYTPIHQNAIPAIEKAITETIEQIVAEGIQQEEMATAMNKAKMAEYNLLETNDMQAYFIGQYYLATGDPSYVFTYLNEPQEEMQEQIRAYASTYFRSVLMHKTLILPLPQEDLPLWQQMQEQSDQLDKQILSARQRATPVEEARYAKEVVAAPFPLFPFPKSQSAELNNGLKMLWYHNDQTPKINLLLECKVKSWFDPEDKQGLFHFVSLVMSEGTKRYTASQLAYELESRGMELTVSIGGIHMSMLSTDFHKGLELLTEVISSALFEQERVDKVRSQLLVNLKQMADSPSYIAGSLMNKLLYKGHPYSKAPSGTVESIEAITQEDITTFYHRYMTPQGAILSVVGDLHNIEVERVATETLGCWTGPAVDSLEFPSLHEVIETCDYSMNRDQVVLTLCRLTITRNDPDYDKLVLFSYIFGGSGLQSKLMQLREQTGLFYSIVGTAVAHPNADKQRDLFVVRTLVSVDRLHEAEKAIKQLINSVVDTITEEDIIDAKNGITSQLIGRFASNSAIAGAFLFIERYGLAKDYLDSYAQRIECITLQEVKDAARKYLNADEMSVIRVGRIPQA